MTSNQAPIDPARPAALALIQATDQGQMISTARQAPAFARLPAAVQARALRLADAVLRSGDRADRLWSPYVSHRPAPALCAALRLGVVEAVALGAPAHAVVSDMVASVKANPKTKSASGMVNAVLRKALADPPAWTSLPPPRYAKALAQCLRQAWGQPTSQAIQHQWRQSQVPVDLCAKGDPAALAEAVGGTMLASGAVRLQPGTQISTLPGFAEGAFWVQDAGAQLAVALSGIQPGEKVADLCAAPGGKTMQLAALGAEVVAVDNNPARLDRLRDNLSRTGLSARILTDDVLTITETGFDAVLLDAPCSATGTLRRHPELPKLFATRNLAELTALQAAMLDHASGLLRPGGRLIYVTCSILPEEGEAQIDSFLQRNQGFALRGFDAAFKAPFLERASPYLRSLPCDWAEQGGMDGFFVAQLEKTAPDLSGR